MTQEEVKTLILSMRKEGTDQVPHMTVHGKEEAIPGPAGDIRVLTYRPQCSGPAPIYINFHGGGFIMGMPEFEDGFCQCVCTELGFTVLNVDYRLAPEHPYPAAVEDCRAVIRHVLAHPEQYGGDPSRIAIGGHSAGANLTAGLSVWAAEEGICTFFCQILDYPPLDVKTSAFEKPLPPGSIPAELARLFDNCYRTEEQAGEVYCSPYYATDAQMKTMPPTILITAEGDSLCREAEQFGLRLMQNGIEVTGRRFLGVGHGFSMPMCMDMEGAITDDDALVQAQDMMIAGLKRCLPEK